jgi:hypothetical protein
MKFDLAKSVEILERTPAILKALLESLSDDWVLNNEGPDTFSPYDVIGHLIHGEKTDWVVRTKLILESGADIPFPLFDRFAQFEDSKGKTLLQLLDEFELLRKKNLEWLQSLQLTEKDFDKTGMHQVLGEVTLRNLLSTWVVHDLTHIAQITRVMAKQYTAEMGPWPDFFRILKF